MIHVIYFSIIILIVFLGGRKLSRTRRALFAAANQRDVEIEARKYSDMRVARLVDDLGAARRREMKHLAFIQSLQNRFFGGKGSPSAFANPADLTDLSTSVRAKRPLVTGGRTYLRRAQ